MKIAYICADFGVPVFGFKGASMHVRELTKAFSKAGHSVCILSPAIEDEKRSNHFLQDLKNIDLLQISQAENHSKARDDLKEIDTFLGRQTRIRQEIRNLFYNRTLYEKAFDYLKNWDVDFIYERYTLFCYAGIKLAKALGVPHILEVNAPLAYEQEKNRGMEMKDLAHDSERRIFQSTDRVLAVSQILKEYVVSCGVNESLVDVLPNSVDPQRFLSGRSNGALTHNFKGKQVIGFVGSLKPWHGTETLLESFKELQADRYNTHLLIVGDGLLRENLEKQAKAMGITSSVTFTGNVDNNRIPDYIGAMDITVAPYIPNENFYFSPIKIFEYMAMAKPVVAGKIGQIAEVITDGETGLLFEPGNIRELTRALEKLLGDSELCQWLGKNARAWVRKERTWEKNASKVSDLVNDILEKKEQK